MSALSEDPYTVLGVSEDADDATIKFSYRMLVMHNNPGESAPSSEKVEAQVRLQSYQKAYEILVDEVSRRKYDEFYAAMKEKMKTDHLKQLEMEVERLRQSYEDEWQSLSENRLSVELAKTREVASGGSNGFANVPTHPYPLPRSLPLHLRPPPTPLPPLRFVPVLLSQEGCREDWDAEGYTSHSEGQGISRPTDTGRLHVEREIEERNERAQRHLQQMVTEPIQYENEEARLQPAEETTPPPRKEKPKLSSVPPTQLGMRVMNPNLDNSDAKVDIVAVHGLGAIPDITWKDSISGVNWLSDPCMLPALTPNARILRFGYDSLWLGKEPIRTRLPTIADKLLLVLARERQDHPRRPLVFIGHCFGGLVIQRALITAKLRPETKTEEAIFHSVASVVFLGTPNRGTAAFGPQSALFAAIAVQSDLYPAM